LFVGSSGNNGTTPTLQGNKLTSSLNPGNFPGGFYCLMLSVDVTSRVLATWPPTHTALQQRQLADIVGTFYGWFPLSSLKQQAPTPMRLR
jgi:hypothetical protein